MADEQNGNDGPSLELPSLGFGRKRRKKTAAPADTPPPAASAEPVPEPETAPEPAPLAPELAEPTAAAVAPAPVDEAPTTTLPVDEPEPAPVPVADPVVDRTVAASPETEVVDAMVPPEPSAPPLFVDEVSPAPRTETTPVATSVPAAEEPATGDDAPAAKPARARRARPSIGGMPAAILTGLLVGLGTVGLTFASLHLCEAARGTSSCGGSGFFLLVAIMVAMVLLGALLLRAFGVPDPGSTSFLAVGLMAVLVLLFLVDVIFNWWMVIVIPVFAMATFALSHWVTTAFIEPAEH